MRKRPADQITRHAQVLLPVAVAALLVVGCGGEKPPKQAQELVKNASRALKGEPPKLEFPKTADDQATIKAKFDDGSELEWDVVLDGADWVLDACDAADAAGLTQDCIPTDPTPPPTGSSAFAECVVGLINLDTLWPLCDPLADPATQQSATAVWETCRGQGRSPGACALLIRQPGG